MFAIGDETGEVWVVGPLDKETVDQYILTILAEDGGEMVVTAGEHIASFPGPRPASRRMQYGKAGEGLVHFLT